MVKPVAASIALTLLAAGCATKGDVRDLRTDIQAVAERQQALGQELRTLQRAALDSLGVQADVLFSLRGEFNRLGIEIQEQLVMIQELTGQSQRSLAGLRDQINAQRAALMEEEQQRQGGEPGGARGGDGQTVGGGDPDGQPSGAQAGGSARDIYNVAVSQFNRGSLTTARAAFERFLSSYPGHALASDAHFYLAEIAYQDNRLEEALEGFLSVQQRFPAATRVAEALYRAGLIHEELGDDDEAVELFERVVNTYPDSNVAILAEDRLNELQ